MCGNRNEDLLKHRSTGPRWMTQKTTSRWWFLGQREKVDRDLLLVFSGHVCLFFPNRTEISPWFMWQNDETTKMSTIRDYFCLWRDLGTLTVVLRGLTSTVPFGWPPPLCCSWPPGSPEMFRSWTLRVPKQDRFSKPEILGNFPYIHTMFRNNLITFHGWLVCNLLQLPFFVGDFTSWSPMAAD